MARSSPWRANTNFRITQSRLHTTQAHPSGCEPTFPQGSGLNTTQRVWELPVMIIEVRVLVHVPWSSKENIGGTARQGIWGRPGLKPKEIQLWWLQSTLKGCQSYTKQAQGKRCRFQKDSSWKQEKIWWSISNGIGIAGCPVSGGRRPAEGAMCVYSETLCPQPHSL